MKKVIKLVGRYNELELGYLEDNTYYKTGLLEDGSHSWKILEWISQNLDNGDVIEVVKQNEDMMDESKCKNKEALLKLIDWAFRNMK